MSAVINKGNLVPRELHVHPLFGKKGNGKEVQVVKLLLYVEITVSTNLTHESFIYSLNSQCPV